MTAIDEQWLYDVSKRIALLTKKVFRLHAETVDRRDDAKHLQQLLEDELATIKVQSKKAIDDANISLKTLHDDIEI